MPQRGFEANQGIENQPHQAVAGWYDRQVGKKGVILYYGFYDHPPHSLRQLARELAISHEMVRQHLLAALAILRHAANSLLLRQLLDHNTVKDYECSDELGEHCHKGREGHLLEYCLIKQSEYAKKTPPMLCTRGVLNLAE